MNLLSETSEELLSALLKLPRDDYGSVSELGSLLAPDGPYDNQDLDGRLKYLKSHGYLDEHTPVTGDRIAHVVIGATALDYFNEKAREEQKSRDNRRHEWALTHVTGAYSIISALIGLIVGYLLGLRAG